MAVIATQTIDIDLTPGNISPFLYVSKGDYGTRNLVFNLLSNGQPYTIPSSVTSIKLEGTTVKGHTFNVSCSYSANGKTATGSLTSDMTGDVGFDICQLALYTSSSGKLGSANFYIVVEQNAVQTGVMYSTSWWTDLAKSWALGETGMRSDEATNNSKYWANQSKTSATSASNAATTSTNNATLARSWAIGGTKTRAGEDSNNSKYWSDLASGYHTSAQNNAKLAESWAVGTGGARTGESTNNSMYWATQANNSATTAATSAANVSARATEAEQAAANAKASEEASAVYNHNVQVTYGSIEAAKQNANSIAETLRTAYERGDFKGEKGDKGDPGTNGVIANVFGLFGFAVENDGDLYLYTDTEGSVSPNDFVYDSTTGDFYYEFSTN